MISVIGIESFSAFWKSEESLSSMAFSNVMPPAWSMVTSGWDCSTSSTMAVIAGSLSTPSAGSPVRSQLTSAERRSSERCGWSTSATSAEASRRVVRSAATAR